MKLFIPLLKNTGIAFLILIIFACQTKKEEKTSQSTDDKTMTEEERPSNISKIYEGKISSLNNEANEERSVTGNVTLTILTDNSLNIQVDASGLEPNMIHLQMLHATKDGTDTQCPGMDADKNGDGYVDVTEAVSNVGITMIPLHENPNKLSIKSDTYPKTDEDGNLKYDKTLSIDSLRNSVKEKFGLKIFDLTKFTYVIHGVDEQANLPASVASVLEKPSHVTLPVGCAVVQKVDTAAY